MQTIGTTSWLLISALSLISIIITMHGCTVLGLFVGHSLDERKFSTDAVYRVDQLDSTMIGKNLEIHAISGTIVKGLYMGNETIAYDRSITLLRLKRGKDIARIDHSTITEIRVYAEKKNATWILGLVSLTVDLYILRALWRSIWNDWDF